MTQITTVYRLAYKPISTAFHDERANRCVNDLVFRSREIAEAKLLAERQTYEKSQLIASRVYVDCQEFENNERIALEQGIRLADYPTRIEKFRSERWSIRSKELPEIVKLTDNSDIFCISELKLIE